MTWSHLWHDSRLCCSVACGRRQHWHSGLRCQVSSFATCRGYLLRQNAQPLLSGRRLLNVRAKRLTYLEQQRRQIVALNTGVQESVQSQQCCLASCLMSNLLSICNEEARDSIFSRRLTHFAHCTEQEVLRMRCTVHSVLCMIIRMALWGPSAVFRWSRHLITQSAEH